MARHLPFALKPDVAIMAGVEAILLRIRRLRAQCTLDTLGEIIIEVGTVREPLVHAQGDGGRCFFRSVRAAVDMPEVASLDELCMLVLCQSATHTDEWSVFFVFGEHAEQRRQVLRQCQTHTLALWEVDIGALPPLQL